MKYVVILTDGAADTPVDELEGKTPYEAADKPTIDGLARLSEVGMVRTVPEGLPPGSDVANLAVFGYDPKKYYTGRSPLEAVSMSVSLELTDTTFRTNVVTLSDEPEYAAKTMIDYSADEIPSEEARELIEYVNKNLATDEYEFYGGFSYRHLMVWHNKENNFKLTPPHDISDRVIGPYLPEDKTILSLMERSYDLLKDHPVNRARIDRGLNPANSLWIWGNGTKPDLPTYAKRFEIKGTVVSAVDLVKGIGLCAGLNVPDIEGVTGNINTNFEGKAEAAIDALRGGSDFVYIHLEAPDEAGHRRETENKVRAIELIDKKIATPVLKYLKDCGEDYRILIMPDHPTPLATRTHSAAPVPYMLYSSANEKESGVQSFTEAEAEKTGIFIDRGYTLANKLFGK